MSGPVLSQAGPQPSTVAVGLDAFEGEYEYRDGATLYMVRHGDELVAIIGDGKYPLKAAGPDVFTNRGGDRIPFVRDEAGRVRAFGEAGETFARRSDAVPHAARRLLDGRPPLADGTRPPYRDTAPPNEGDGIAVGVAGPDTLPSASPNSS